jgi:hypothetical protein
VSERNDLSQVRGGGSEDGSAAVAAPAAPDSAAAVFGSLLPVAT